MLPNTGRIHPIALPVYPLDCVICAEAPPSIVTNDIDISKHRGALCIGIKNRQPWTKTPRRQFLRQRQRHTATQPADRPILRVPKKYADFGIPAKAAQVYGNTLTLVAETPGCNTQCRIL